MATTVDNAFAQFLVDPVRLDPERSKIAKGSKEWLVGEIVKFPTDGKFPTIHPDVSIEYGSFSRKTKIRPLDDIDIMIILHAQGAFYYEDPNKITITNTGNAAHFTSLCIDGTNQINSIKVVNKLKEYLGNIPQYKKADLKRNQEAVTLELLTYEWVYDIVPCFITNPESNARTYYLIPDGTGHWKKSDPRIDRTRVMTIDSDQKVSVLDMIRLVKYWNKRPTMPSVRSYTIENIVLNYFVQGIHTKYVDLEMIDALAYIANAILASVPDPKGIQGDLNTLAFGERDKIRQRALLDHTKASEARAFESNGHMKEAITKWGEIFGDRFPTFNF
jgi:hypothetical protein